MILRCLIFAAASAAAALPSLAASATYYLDYVGGDDDAAGTSEGSAWKHHPWDTQVPAGTVSALTTPNSSSLVYFKRGVDYGGVIYLRSDGHDTDKMHFTDKEGWGTGRARLSSTNLFTLAIACRTSGGTDRAGKNYIISNLDFYKIGGYVDDDPIFAQDCTQSVSQPRGGTALNFDKGVVSLVVSNCNFLQLGQWRNQPPFRGNQCITGTGINIEGAIDVVVTNCSFAKMKVGVSLKTQGDSSTNRMVNVQIKSNSFGGELGHMHWLIDVAPRASGYIISNVFLENNVLNNSADFDLGNWTGCPTDRPHTDMMFIRSAAQVGVWTNFFIRNNFFFLDRPGASQGGTAGIYISQGPSATIEGNTMVALRQGNACILVGFPPLGGTTQHVVIRHNTIWSTSRAIATGAYTNTSRSKRTLIYNNLVVRNLTGNYDIMQFETNAVSGGDTVVYLDYNAYSQVVAPESSSGYFYWNDVRRKLSYVQARGFEVNCVDTLDPGLAFGTVINGPIVPSLLSYRPAAGSPLIGAGIDPGDIGLGPTDTYPDPDGNARANPPTIGAYEYNAVGAVPDVPTGLNLTVLSSSQIQVAWADVATETSYELQRKTGSGGTYATVGTFGANVVLHLNSGLTAATTYYYRVRAANGFGNSSYSSEANATTLASTPPVGAVVSSSGFLRDFDD